MRNRTLIECLLIGLLCFSIIPNIAVGQFEYVPHFTAGLHTYSSSSENLPFWLIHNKNGAFDFGHSNYLLADMAIGKGYSIKDKWIDVGYGIEFYGAYADSFKYRFQQFFIDLKLYRFNLSIGAKADSTVLNGLSVCNKNWLKSNNARPNQSISFGTLGYLPLLRNNHDFMYSFRYEEGLMLDERYVSKPRLHRKKLFLRYGYPEEFQLTIGAEHAVIWGGDSPDVGKISSDLPNYVRSVLGIKGNSSSVPYGDTRAPGFHLGYGMFDAVFNVAKIRWNAYWLHPFSFKGTGRFGNNIVGVSADLDYYTDVVDRFLFEIHQLNQFGLVDTASFTGNFRSELYPTGYSFFNHMIGNPLQGALGSGTVEESRFENDHVFALHTGFKGNIKNYFRWKVLATYVNYYGSILNPYPNPLGQLYWLMEWTYHFAPGNMNLSLVFGGDQGVAVPLSFGGGLRLSWRIN